MLGKMWFACVWNVSSGVRGWLLCAALFLVLSPSAKAANLQAPQSKETDINAPNPKTSHHAEKTSDLREKLHKQFDPKNAAYAGSNIQAAVDDRSVTLTGTVVSDTQHEMALQLAQAQADDRKVLDRLIVQSH